MKQISNWIAFCSQTGFEIMNICLNLDIKPIIVITNNRSRLNKDVLDFFYQNEIILVEIPSNPKIEHYQTLNISKDTIITLHGYLRIIPKEFCEIYKNNIYNGHPGLITEFPELKGIDPQKKAYNMKIRRIGSVIHRVTADVDCGDIVISHHTIMNSKSTLDDYYRELTKTSLLTWIEFFKSYGL